ncbi:MAG: DUF3307 domain-containing protein [Anaerolineaceae bacterium]|nr:DUF3307 domain-containing protein [Anaerolineaceae bacterium]
MTASPLLLLLTSHLIGDVVISSHYLAVMKRDARTGQQIAGIGIHCCFHAIAAGILLYWAGYTPLLGALLVFGQHFVIDLTRCRIEMKVWEPDKAYQTLSSLITARVNPLKTDKKGFTVWAILLGADQSLHFSALYVISLILGKYPILK